jgi:glycosyltransferase involved in cell wall biosynthesis
VTISGFYLNPHGIIAFIIAKLTGKKVVVSLIAGRPELYTKGSTSGIDFSITPLPWYGKIYLNILKHSDAIVTTGSVTKNFLVMQGVTADKIYPIISPANATRFYVTNQPKIYDILSVGYLYLIKHQEVFLKAISLVKDNYPDIKACVVGYGPLKDALVKLADELGISKNVDFVGFQTNISFYYNASKIFVHTSESEGFPNVVLEAMMCGVPCVVSNCGDIIDLAKDGVNSTVIQKFDDYEGFAKAIISLLENTQLYYSLRQNALKTMELTSIENVTQLWELIMAKLLLPMTNNTN